MVGAYKPETLPPDDPRVAMLSSHVLAEYSNWEAGYTRNPEKKAITVRKVSDGYYLPWRDEYTDTKVDRFICEYDNPNL